jgi:hypothetical protein
MSKPKGAGDEGADRKDSRGQRPEETPGAEPVDELMADMPMIVDGAAGGLAALQQPLAEPPGASGEIGGSPTPGGAGEGAAALPGGVWFGAIGSVCWEGAGAGSCLSASGLDHFVYFGPEPARCSLDEDQSISAIPPTPVEIAAEEQRRRSEERRRRRLGEQAEGEEPLLGPAED